jgi:outer membrane protein OmpA-like peptidoglycan-associated protein
MKKIFFLASFIFFSVMINAQVTNILQNSKKFTQISLRGGFDEATKHNFTQFVKIPLKGFDAGASFDKYWNWFGFGMDIDYLQNEKPVYDDAVLTTKLGGWKTTPGWLTTSTASTKLSRIFAGIGPSIKLQPANSKFIAELNLRGGITLTNGSVLTYSTKAVNPLNDWAFTRNGDATGVNTTWGTFNHDGYKNELVATAKAQIRFNYYIKPKLAVNVGAYYMYYFGSAESYNYLDVTQAPAYWGLIPMADVSALSSLGFSAGISYRFGNSNSSNSKIAKNSLTVFVKDELTGQPLSDAAVTAVDANGKIFKGTTNSAGMAIFNKIADGNCKVNGFLHDIATTDQSVILNNSNRNATVTLLHNDPRFTVIGKAINLNGNIPEAGVSVSLKNIGKGSVKMATSQSGNGGFSFQIDGNSDYELVGKKASYISNIEKITTKGLTRSQTLYVELEIGVLEVEKGKSLILQKIYYDLDKANIRQDASPDLEKLILFLQDNPTFNIEIASHTDSRGSDDYNLKLSQDRAQAVVNYLTQKGITLNRLSAKGYGETRLINKCANGVNCSEEEHQLNRRTEFTVLSN